MLFQDKSQMGSQDFTKGRKPIKGMFSNQLPLFPLERARKRHNPCTVEFSHQRDEGAVVFTHQTPWIRLGVNFQELPSGDVGGKMISKWPEKAQERMLASRFLLMASGVPKTSVRIACCVCSSYSFLQRRREGKGKDLGLRCYRLVGNDWCIFQAKQQSQFSKGNLHMHFAFF